MTGDAAGTRLRGPSAQVGPWARRSSGPKVSSKRFRARAERLKGTRVKGKTETGKTRTKLGGGGGGHKRAQVRACLTALT